MSKVVIKKKVLINSNKKYFRTGAEKVVVGTYGKKENAAIASSFYLFGHKNISLSKADIQIYGPHDLDTEKTAKSELELPVNASVANGNVALDYNSLKTQKVKFLQVYISTGPLMDALNADGKALEYLRNQNKARIADTVFIAVEAEFYSKVDFSADISAETSIDGVDIKLKLKPEFGNTTSLKLASNTVIAYGTVEPIWNNTKTKITDFEPDLKGVG